MTSENVVLISYSNLTQSAELSDNLDPKLIRIITLEVQEQIIKRVIGSNLYEKLKSEVNGSTLADPYKFLVNEVIKPVLINGILTELPFRLNYRFSNVGLQTRTSEHATAPTFADTQKLSDHYRAKQVHYSSKLREYLDKNSTSFPEYNSEEDSNEAPKKETFFCGIVL